jgi:hypothetical protein
MQTRRKVPRWFPMLYLSPLSPHSPALLPCKCTLESAAPEIIHSSKPELHVSNAFKKSEEGTTRNSSIPGPSASSPKTQPDGQRQKLLPLSTVSNALTCTETFQKTLCSQYEIFASVYRKISTYYIEVLNHNPSFPTRQVSSSQV